jgi:phosphate transport system substrate-binding protein
MVRQALSRSQPSRHGEVDYSRSCHIKDFAEQIFNANMKDYVYMKSYHPKGSLLFACLCTLAVPSLAAQDGKTSGVKRLYLEPFTTQTGSEKLQSDILVELRKLRSIVVVSSESSADVILGGGGEIWVKGYRSLNPRSGRSPANGTPVYDGFLSVELRDPKGATLWSYLATPSATSIDVPKDLARRIVKHLPEGLDHVAGPPPESVPPQRPVILKGAGATFPNPVYAKWFTNYRRENPSIEINYDSVGSKEGVRQLLAGETDFAASDSPEVIRDLAPAKQEEYSLFPSVVGAVVPIVNLPGLSSDISLSSEVLADIYLGKIKKWDDPTLRRINRGLRLPNLDIVVIHRGDGSGTSYAWTDYLSQTSSEWSARVGTSLSPAWPTGRPAIGNDGVAKLVKELGGSIGYVEFIYALKNHLSFARVRNRSGEFVAGSLESMAIAASQSVHIHDDFKVSIVNAPGAGAYPIASFTWFVVPTHIADDGKRNAVIGFLKWMLGPGQPEAAALGYLALPEDVVSKEEAAILKIH